MELVNNEIRNAMGNSSWIRRMFEAGLELKKQYGADKVYDFSLGNPDLPPPPEVKRALTEIAGHADEPFSIGYMPNAGFMNVRELVAKRVSAEQGCELGGPNVIMTCGAAGGLNVFFRAVLEPGDEVIVPTPYFVEYDFYAGNFGGKLVKAPSKELTFELDIAAFERAFSPRTRAVIINSPNNPTGRIYTRGELEALAELIRAMEKKYNRAIYLISDEPYRFLNFAGSELPPVMGLFPHAVVIGSYSKNLSLAGERLGYIAVAPGIPGSDQLMAALMMCNRILGFVNAPALGQKIIAECLDAEVDPGIYRDRRDAMARVLDAAGIEYTMPQGAFYFFPKSPTADESVFIDALLKQRVLAVPGRGFGRSGYFRVAFCVDRKVIEGATEGFRAAVAAVAGK
jgi:aspartate aminotransferase